MLNIKLPKQIDTSMVAVGTKILVKIIDELPDGDGSVLFQGVDEVQYVQQNGMFQLFNTGYIAKPGEVLRVYKKRKSMLNIKVYTPC
jgi:hypothetical protein